MNVLKPHKKATVITLLANGVSRNEISRKAGIDIKTVRKYATLHLGAAVADQEESKSHTLEQVATGEGQSKQEAQVDAAANGLVAKAWQA